VEVIKMAKSANEMSSGELLIFLDLCKRVAVLVAGEGKDFSVLESTSDLRDIVNRWEVDYKKTVDATAKTVELIKERLRKVESGDYKTKS
jgi:hypothetical protein